MKILIVSGGYLPIPAVLGGAVEKLAEGYINENEKKFKNQIDLITIPSNEIDISKYKCTNFIFIENKPKIYSLPYRAKSFITGKYSGNYYINKIIKYLTKFNKKYDVILVLNEPSFTIKLRKICDAKIVLHLHNDFVNKNSRYYNEVINSCDKIVPVSNFIKNRIGYSSKCNVCYNGIDFSDFREKRDNVILNIKNKYQIEDDDFVFIFVGRVVPEKGVMCLVRAFNRLNKDFKNIKLLIVGSAFFGKKSNSKFYEEVKKAANENVIFTGYINNNELSSYINCANILITPSIIDEAFGLTALEGLICGKRVIVSDSGALVEFAADENGVVVKRKNLEENLYNAMKNELVNPKKFKDLNYDKFSIQNYAQNLENILLD